MGNTSEWQPIRQYQTLLSAAERTGFAIAQDIDSGVKIFVKHKPPYVDGVTIAFCSSFATALAWFDGYEQHIFEQKNS
jgi:hypothetical protein